MKNIEIFTDGSSLGNPGPSGYGIILKYKNYKKEISCGYRISTNNRMELMAVIVALEKLKEPCNVSLTVDSKYVLYGANYWIQNWKKYNWYNKKRKVIKNLDLWQRFEKSYRIHKCKWTFIHGHSKHIENELCDEMAKRAAIHPTNDDIAYANYINKK